MFLDNLGHTLWKQLLLCLVHLVTFLHYIVLHLYTMYCTYNIFNNVYIVSSCFKIAILNNMPLKKKKKIQIAQSPTQAIDFTYLTSQGNPFFTGRPTIIEREQACYCFTETKRRTISQKKKLKYDIYQDKRASLPLTASPADIVRCISMIYVRSSDVYIEKVKHHIEYS